MDNPATPAAGPVTEIVINIVYASASEKWDAQLIVGRMILKVGKPGEMVTEMFDEGDPRRVMNPPEQLQHDDIKSRMI